MCTSPGDDGDPDQAGQHSPGRLLDLHRDRQQVDVESLRLVPTFRHRRRRAALSGPLAGMPVAINWPAPARGRLLDLYRGRQRVDVEAQRLVPDVRRRRGPAAMDDHLVGTVAAIQIRLASIGPAGRPPHVP